MSTVKPVSKKEQTRERILRAAARAIRKHGYEGVGVADVMKEAGLTHGGFYGYFASKDDLIAEALNEALRSTEWQPADLTAFVEQYLSLRHRDNCAGGCAIAALASESIRQGGGARAEMTASLKRRIDDLSRVAPGADKRRKRRAAIGSLAATIGGLILARMSDDGRLSDEVLSETRAWLAAQLRG